MRVAPGEAIRVQGTWTAPAREAVARGQLYDNFVRRLTGSDKFKATRNDSASVARLEGATRRAVAHVARVACSLASRGARRAARAGWCVALEATARPNWRCQACVAERPSRACMRVRGVRGRAWAATMII